MKDIRVDLISRVGGEDKKRALETAGFDVSLYPEPATYSHYIHQKQGNPPDIIVSPLFFTEHRFPYCDKWIDGDKGDHIRLLLEEFPRTKFVVYTFNRLESPYELQKEVTKAENQCRLIQVDGVMSFVDQVVPRVRTIARQEIRPLPPSIPKGDSPTRVVLIKDPSETQDDVTAKADMLASVGHDVYVIGNATMYSDIARAFDGIIHGLVGPEHTISREMSDNLSRRRIPVVDAHIHDDFRNVVGILQRRVLQTFRRQRYTAPGKVFVLKDSAPS